MACGSGVRRAAWFDTGLVFFVDAPGLFELVFEDDDAAGSLDRSALVDEFAGASGDLQLVAGVAPVAALRAQGRDQAGFTERPQEGGCGAEHFGGPAHGVGGVVVVIETT